MALLDVENLRVRFETHHGVVRAVTGRFALEEGETLGLVGESGSGKSVTSLADGARPPATRGRRGRRADSRGPLTPRDVGPSRVASRPREREVSMIFQDPMTSLNPLLTIGRQLTEVLEVHERVTRREARRRAAKGLDDVGIPEPEKLRSVSP